MAMKDILGRFKKEPEEEFIPEEFVPEEAPVEEKPSFVFTDINSEPIDPAAAEPVPETPVNSGPVKVGSSDNDRIQMFEIDLGGSKVKLPEEPVIEEPPVVEEPVYETYVPVSTPAPEPEAEDTIVVAPTPEAAGAEEDYEVDFGYSAPGALDDVTYTTDPAAVPSPAEPEPVVYTRSEAPADNDEEYYDSYEPMFEESYGPGSYFAGEENSASEVFEAPADEAPEVAEPVETVNGPETVPTYTDDRPRYENYRKAKNKARYNDEPRSYENNIDDSVFLPDEGDAPVFSRKNRRRLTIAILAVLVALLFVLGGFLISHFTHSGKDAETATTAKVKTTAFERSVSNNASATESTTVEEITVQYDENGEISESTASTTYSTSRRTSTRTTTRRSTSSTTRSTATTTRSTTASTTQSTAPATTTPSTAVPSTEPSTRSTTAAPSPWEHVGG